MWPEAGAAARPAGVEFSPRTPPFYLVAGLRSHAVAELLGHSDAGLVDRLYGHALPSEVRHGVPRRALGVKLRMAAGRQCPPLTTRLDQPASR